MCSIICNLLFKHSYNGIYMGNSISNTICENYLIKISRTTRSSFHNWMPRINTECRRHICHSITKATKKLKLPIFNISINTINYMCNQISYYITICILRNELIDFTINKSIETDKLLSNKIIIEEEVYNSFKEKFSKMNDGSIIKLNTNDVIEVEVLRVKFNMLVKSLIEKINFLHIIDTTYRYYTNEKNEKYVQLRNSYSKFI